MNGTYSEPNSYSTRPEILRSTLIVPSRLRLGLPIGFLLSGSQAQVFRNAVCDCVVLALQYTSHYILFIDLYKELTYEHVQWPDSSLNFPFVCPA